MDTNKQITPDALKMAWKMVETIFPRYQVPAKEQNALLTGLTAIALEDLLGTGELAWKQPLPAPTILMFDGPSVKTKRTERTRLVLKDRPAEGELDRVIEWAEEVFDKYNLSEEERATLYTALPCLGLEAIQAHITWQADPPFAELGE